MEPKEKEIICARLLSNYRTESRTKNDNAISKSRTKLRAMMKSSRSETWGTYFISFPVGFDLHYNRAMLNDKDGFILVHSFTK